LKQRAETKADIEKKIDQCNRRLGLVSDNLNELKAARADLESWQRNLSLAEQDRLSLSAICPAPDRGRNLANHSPPLRFRRADRIAACRSMACLRVA